MNEKEIISKFLQAKGRYSFYKYAEHCESGDNVLKNYWDNYHNVIEDLLYRLEAGK